MADKKEGKKEFRKYKPGRLCPKCGSHMADHANRASCGRCGYTEFKAQGK